MADSPRLGIDWGKARIGVAAAGAHSTFAYPVTTVPAGQDGLRQLLEVVEEYGPTVIYVGLPIDLKGIRGIAAEFIEAKAIGLASALQDVEVRLVDERMSTAAASRSLGSVGRSVKAQRGIIDQAAAVVILQTALDAEEREGAPVGSLVEGGN